jgi:cytidylate kinase
LQNRIIVAIDGPAGAGKSTIARAVASALGAVYIDTGAMYRAVALLAIRGGKELDDESALTELAEQASIELSAGGLVMLDGEDVSGLIRTPEIAQAASKVSALPGVRRAMVASQRRMAESCSVVMEGRDIGTVVFPDAQVKIYLDASPGVRAMRRVLEMRQKGMEADPAQVEAEIRERDHRDSNRAEAPLTQAPGAVYVDTSPMGVDEVVSTLLRIAGERIGKGVEA